MPITSELRELLDEIPKRSTTILTSSDRRPWTEDGFGSSFWKAKCDAGVHAAKKLRFHDLRGTAATRFHRAGLSNRAIAEIMGWSEIQVDRMLDRYVKRDEIILDQIERLEEFSAAVKARSAKKNIGNG